MIGKTYRTIRLTCAAVVIVVMIAAMSCGGGGKEAAQTQMSARNDSGGVSEALESVVDDGGDSFTDTRDGKTYRAVKIGNLTWMAKNLNHQTDNSWCYDDDNSNCAKYGRLYTWDAARSACPSGWRLPAREDWDALVQTAGGVNVGRQLKANDGWNGGGNGTDAHGFSALPGGGRWDGNFGGVGSGGNWWTTTGDGTVDAHHRGMFYDDEGVHSYSGSKSYSFSVRCVQGVSIAPAEPQQPKAEGFDLAKILKTEIPFIGVIGDERQKMQLVFLSMTQINETRYEATGKSKVRDNICDFKGTIEITEIREFEGFLRPYGVKYHFEEDKNQSGTGVFEGTFLGSCEENDEGILFDIVNCLSGLRRSYDFNGTWRSYRTGATRSTSWGNHRWLLPGTFNDGQEYTRAENYRSIGWGPYFDRQSHSSEGKQAEREYQEQWVDWWK